MAAYKIMCSSKAFQSKRDEIYPGIIILEYLWHPTIKRVIKRKARLPENNNMKELFIFIFSYQPWLQAQWQLGSPRSVVILPVRLRRLMHDSMSKWARRIHMVSLSFPGMLVARGGQRGPQGPPCAARTSTRPPSRASDKYGSGGGELRRRVLLSLFLSPFVKWKPWYHKLGIALPSGHAESWKNLLKRIMSGYFLLCQHHIAGTAWEHWFLWLVCLGQITHTLYQPSLLLLLLIK